MNILIKWLRAWLGTLGARPFPIGMALLTPLMAFAATNFQGGVLSKGVPAEAGDADLLTLGTVWFVDSGHADASDGNVGKDPRKPLATLDAAFNAGKVTANNGDVVLLAAGHAETLAAAAAVNIDKAGVTIIGLGNGADRPTFTFSATDSTITMTAASCKLRNVILKPSIDSVVSPVVVSAADCEIDAEVQDASDAVEFVRAILTTAAADRLKIRLRYLGRTGGDACVNAIRLVGGDGARIFIDFYGKASTAVVEFLTTACTDVRVEGLIHNSGTSDHSKTVVDTATGSTWSAQGYDSVADEGFSGGDQSAVAGDDLSTIEDMIGGTAGIAAWAAAAAPANGVSLSEAIRAIYDRQLGDGTDASTSVLGKRVTKAADMTVVNDALFTVTGMVAITLLVGKVTAALDANVTTMKVDVDSVDMCLATTVTSDALGTLYRVTGHPDALLNGGTAPLVGFVGATAEHDSATDRSPAAPPFIVDDQGGGAIDHVLGAADQGTGVVTWTLFYIPLEDGASVAAAA